MSGYLQEAGSFGPADYAVFVLMLVVSSGIGVYYAWVDRRKKSSSEFLTGGRTLTFLPVSMSLAASSMSSTTILSNPAEVYRFGAIFGLIVIAYPLSMVVTSEIFLPIFYRLNITSTYEYLELRFNKATRLLGTTSFLIQITLYAGVTVYGPALALNEVIGMNLWTGIFSTAMVCTFYCTLGGLKAVVWTDVFQIGLMLSGFLAIIIKAVIVQEGISTIFADAQQGGRLNFWDFDLNPLRRHTVWTLVVGGTFIWTTVYGVSPPSVQRYVSCRSITHARLALYVNLLGLWACLVSAVFAGLCLYSVYKSCDPWTAGLVSSPDQLIPHMVMHIFTNNPGLPGLFLAAVYSGSLSTVSSCISALAAVTLEDLIKPHTKLSEKQQLVVSKALSLFYGLVCIGMAGIASFLGGMMQAVAVIGSVTGGPLLGVFSLGMLCPFANSKGALSGLVMGFVATMSVSLGDLISRSPPEMTRPLPLTTEGCNLTTAGDQNWTSTVLPEAPSFVTTTPALHGEGMNLAGKWYSPSYLYYCLIGAVTVFTVGVIVSLLTGGWREKTEARLTLQKEDTTFYHLFRFAKGCVMKGADKPDLTGKPEGGDTNPASSCDLEMDALKANLKSSRL
ncbi:sodium-coupled monocarboxylate transporter 1 [Kryptolebias marmoratus]|uniref:sodium-coupled monocarboxylate transporter 1 n=1 Tax=Kryptolebias marmoratus TaxID=37003 RepID=UPI0007F8E90B|nr:sodium-coupled monocarboxylate transporter 1 [Kryptolebias marmoratus]